METSGDELVKAARKWVAEGVYEAALDILEAARKLSPGNLEILFLLGKSFEELGQPFRAKPFYKEVLDADPGWGEGAASSSLKHVMDILEDAEEGLASCRKMLSHDPFCAEVFLSIAHWLRRLGLLDEALLNLKDAKSCGWDYPEEVLQDMGRVHMERGDFDAASTCFGEALAINPSTHYAWFCRAASLRKLHRYREALESIDRAQGIYPNARGQWLRNTILEDIGAIKE